MPSIAGINHVSITVTDLERSLPWYTELFELEKLMNQTLADGSSYALIGRPDFSLCIGLHIHPDNEGELFSETRTGLDHVCFLVPSRTDLDRWQERLRDLDVPQSPIADQRSGCRSSRLLGPGVSRSGQHPARTVGIDRAIELTATDPGQPGRRAVWPRQCR